MLVSVLVSITNVSGVRVCKCAVITGVSAVVFASVSVYVISVNVLWSPVSFLIKMCC